jgi:hypothetical protein
LTSNDRHERHTGSRRPVLEGRRFWEQQLRTLLRGMLLAFWALVLWGSLLLLALAWAALTRGPSAAAETAAALSLANRLLIATALASWLTVLGIVWRRRAPADDPAADAGPRRTDRD